MAKHINNPNEDKIEKVGEAVSNTEEFFKKNGKKLSYTGVALILVAAVVVLLFLYYYNPLKDEAIAQTFPAEQYFEAQDYEKALNGDGNSLGFAQIIDEYGAKAGKAVYFYAGACELQLGNAEAAISYLNKYKGKEPVIKARALACTGDAYSILGNYETALGYYLRAAAVESNIIAPSYLLKAGIICEELGRNDEALKYYREIKDRYPQSMEGTEIDKYISRLEVEVKE
ncbi:MAG TPA: tetratricopeptide repeat protein [Candidatus Coprenecus pullistercoris]|nr:tetratricopeptide repeat protein [Candidatus Coprenecus pullistercoris]